MDELGRGTSTKDGQIIAKTILYQIEHKNQSRCLFTTHYHDIIEWCQKEENISLNLIRVKTKNALLKYTEDILPEKVAMLQTLSLLRKGEGNETLDRKINFLKEFIKKHYELIDISYKNGSVSTDEIESAIKKMTSLTAPLIKKYEFSHYISGNIAPAPALAIYDLFEFMCEKAIEIENVELRTMINSDGDSCKLGIVIEAENVKFKTSFDIHESLKAIIDSIDADINIIAGRDAVSALLSVRNGGGNR